MRNKSCRILAILTTIFASLMVVFLCLFLSFLATTNNYKTQLENNYMKSFYEMVDSVNTLEVNLSKVIATNNLTSQRELLDDIYMTCMIGVDNVNNLPINNYKLSEINKLLNTTGGFAYSLLLNNINGSLINNNDFEQINKIYSNVKSLQFDINNYMRKLQYDYSILEEVDFNDVDNSYFSGGITDTESSNSEVPTLIYDGPFSDSVINKEIRGLGDTLYTREEVENKLKSIFENSEIKYIGDTKGKFETYNFEVKNGSDLYVSVTKQGGLILSITSFGEGTGESISSSQGIIYAEDFASKLGFENMYSVWYQQSGNILYVNLAPIVNKCIHYTDLIKVKVDLSATKIVGWEATNYATNHIDRSFTSSIGILDVQKNLSPQLTVVERNFCIIPGEYVGEISAYEFICEWEDYTYYVYIDSNTGNEINILRIIETNDGQLLM